MKILQIDVNYKYSSTGKIVHDLHQKYQDAGFESYVYYGRGEKIKEENVVKFGIDLETYFHAFMTRLTGLVGFYSPFSTHRLIRALKKVKPDIIHIHELHAYFVNYGPLIRYIKKKKIKTIWTFHCEHMYTGKCAYTYECNKYQSQCKRCPQKKEYPKSWFFDFSNFMFKHKRKLFNEFENLIIVTPSQWLASRVKKSFLKEFSIEVVNNGISDTFKPMMCEDVLEKHNIKDEIVVLSVAPNLMDPRKGGRTVLKLAAKTRNIKIKYIMIGVENPPINDLQNVIYLPKIRDQKLLAKYYSSASLTLLTSQLETFSMVTAESLMCGTPVIGYDSGAPTEIAPEPYGKFVKYGDIKSLERILRANLNLKSKISPQNIADFAEDKYSKEIMGNKYINLIKTHHKFNYKNFEYIQILEK